MFCFASSYVFVDITLLTADQNSTNIIYLGVSFIYFLVCPPLLTITNGEISPVIVLNGPSPIGTIAVYTCLQGFFSSSTVLESECVSTVLGPGWDARKRTKLFAR